MAKAEGGNSMAHLMATQSVLDFGGTNGEEKTEAFFPDASFARLPDPRINVHPLPRGSQRILSL